MLPQSHRRTRTDRRGTPGDPTTLKKSMASATGCVMAPPVPCAQPDTVRVSVGARRRDVGHGRRTMRRHERVEGLPPAPLPPPPGATEVLLVRHGESAARRPRAPVPARRRARRSAARPRRSRAGRAPGRPSRRGADRRDLRDEPSPHGRDRGAAGASTRSRARAWSATCARCTSASGRAGCSAVKVAEHDPAFVQAMEEQRWDAIPGAEPRIEFVGRVWDGHEPHRRRPSRRAGRGRVARRRDRSAPRRRHRFPTVRVRRRRQRVDQPRGRSTTAASCCAASTT